jgi:signal transduction histidine kinase
LGTKWKKYSYSVTTKIIVFLISVLCFSGAITVLLNIIEGHNGDFNLAFEKNYYVSESFITDSQQIVQTLTDITQKYKSEENILNGGTISEDNVSEKENQMFEEFQYSSKSYNPNLSTAENYKVFQEVYADRISQIRNQIIQYDLRQYRSMLRSLNEYHGLVYCVNNDKTVFTNSPNKSKEYFKSFPSYMIFDSSEQVVYPSDIKENTNYHWISPFYDQLELQDTMYIAFSQEFLNPRIAQWEKDKSQVTNSLYQLAGFSLALLLALIYLFLVTGRKSDDQAIHLNSVDRIYNDINLFLCLLLILTWFGFMSLGLHYRFYYLVFPITLLIAVPGLILVLSLVKHIKNRTFIKHSLLYILFYKLFDFIKDVYNSGSVAVKVVIAVIVYPIIAGLTFFVFPITLGLAAWLALKKVKEFNAIKDGVKQVKEGNLHYTIEIPGEGEFAQLAADINTITDGLKKAVANEIKSERLKSELITNVSHDIRTPLTSIITYVDLLKNEPDQVKSQEYIDIIDQKAQRLKTLTDDLFEATKASSGNMPVNYERIDLVSLLTQGLGEFDDKIQECRLDFKLSHPDKVYINADGKLLWRAIENLLMNIFKYALEGSRVYIDIIESGSEVTLTIKNISAVELNISPDELMERFKRGDVSRSSQGSGLGLSIAQSLIEIQQGSFNIAVDGDLFKAIIRLPGA